MFPRFAVHLGKTVQTACSEENEQAKFSEKKILKRIETERSHHYGCRK